MATEAATMAKGVTLRGRGIALAALLVLLVDLAYASRGGPSVNERESLRQREMMREGEGSLLGVELGQNPSRWGLRTWDRTELVDGPTERPVKE